MSAISSIQSTQSPQQTLTGNQLRTELTKDLKEIFNNRPKDALTERELAIARVNCEATLRLIVQYQKQNTPVIEAIASESLGISQGGASSSKGQSTADSHALTSAEAQATPEDLKVKEDEQGEKSSEASQDSSRSPSIEPQTTQEDLNQESSPLPLNEKPQKSEITTVQEEEFVELENPDSDGEFAPVNSKKAAPKILEVHYNIGDVFENLAALDGKEWLKSTLKNEFKGLTVKIDPTSKLKDSFDVELIDSHDELYYALDSFRIELEAIYSKATVSVTAANRVAIDAGVPGTRTALFKHLQTLRTAYILCRECYKLLVPQAEALAKRYNVATQTLEARKNQHRKPPSNNNVSYMVSQTPDEAKEVALYSNSLSREEMQHQLLKATWERTLKRAQEAHAALIAFATIVAPPPSKSGVMSFLSAQTESEEVKSIKPLNFSL